MGKGNPSPRCWALCRSSSPGMLPASHQGDSCSPLLCRSPFGDPRPGDVCQRGQQMASQLALTLCSSAQMEPEGLLLPEGGELGAAARGSRTLVGHTESPQMLAGQQLPTPQAGALGRAAHPPCSCQAHPRCWGGRNLGGWLGTETAAAREGFRCSGSSGPAPAQCHQVPAPCPARATRGSGRAQQLSGTCRSACRC